MSFSLAMTVAAGCQSGGDDAGPVPISGGAFGLAGRPRNTTCRPPERYTDPAATLKGTGCVDPKDPTRPAAGLIPYVVASPLWSDGAAKERFMALPDGATIHVKDCGRDACAPVAQGGASVDDGHFEFPVGTVLMKSFLFGNRRFETRLFVRFSEARWVGYSYRWNADHTDATLVGQDGEHQSVVNAAGAEQGWAFPSHNDCLLCHNDAAGSSLGPETRQLNIDYRYPSGVTSNQIATLEHIGMFDGAVKPLPPLPDPAAADAASLEERARSYLHANCAICHRPDGKFPGIDMRFGVHLEAMGICQQDSTKGTANASLPAQRLVPGHPEQSTTYSRMATPDGDIRMPQVATSVVDPVGTPLIAEWIRSITACPGL